MPARPLSASPLSLAPPLAISLRSAHLTYGGLVLFDGLDLELPGGVFTCLLGPSGIGKSSLLRLLAGLTSPGVSGDLRGSDGRGLTGRVAYMAQQDLLLPWLSVLQNVTLGSRLRSEPANRGRALDLLAQVGRLGRCSALVRPGHPIRWDAPAGGVGPHSDGRSAVGADGRAVFRVGCPDPVCACKRWLPNCWPGRPSCWSPMIRWKRCGWASRF
jgi:hypothetical protein